MLSAKKNTIATNNIEFFGMTIKDSHYQQGKHIAQELIHFPDQHISKRQLQQFLGIINYIRKDGWVRCSEPFKDLVLSPEVVCVGVLEVYWYQSLLFVSFFQSGII